MQTKKIIVCDKIHQKGLDMLSLESDIAFIDASDMDKSELLNIVGLDEKLKKVDVQFTISGLFGWIVKWFIIIAVLLTVSSILGLEEVSQFLMQVLLYVPKVLVAVVILTIGLVVGNFMSELVEKSVEISDFVNEASVSVLSAATKWIIVIFALMAALSQLGIAQDLIQILFTGIVAMFAIAGGLAFGLGGKDKAQAVCPPAAPVVVLSPPPTSG